MNTTLTYPMLLIPFCFLRTLSLPFDCILFSYLIIRSLRISDSRHLMLYIPIALHPLRLVSFFPLCGIYLYYQLYNPRRFRLDLLNE